MNGCNWPAGDHPCGLSRPGTARLERGAVQSRHSDHRGRSSTPSHSVQPLTSSAITANVRLARRGSRDRLTLGTGARPHRFLGPKTPLMPRVSALVAHSSPFSEEGWGLGGLLSCLTFEAGNLLPGHGAVNNEPVSSPPHKHPGQHYGSCFCHLKAAELKAKIL